MNNINIIGRLCDDITYRETQSGQTAAYFRTAVKSMTFRGEIRTDHIFCRAWGATADSMRGRFKKGSRIAISGSLRTDCWKHKGEKNYVTYIAVRRILPTSDIFGEDQQDYE